MLFVRASAAPQQKLQLWEKVQTAVHLLEKCLIGHRYISGKVHRS